MGIINLQADTYIDGLRHVSPGWFYILNNLTVHFNDSIIDEFSSIGNAFAVDNIAMFGNVSFNDDTIDYFEDNTTLTRTYPLQLEEQGIIYKNHAVYIIDGSGNTYASTSTDDNGRAEITMAWNSSNYNTQFYLADDSKVAFYGITPTTDTPIITDMDEIDLSFYPFMFINNELFDGYLVVGKNASALNTIAVTNIALGIQSEAVSDTYTCNINSSSPYSEIFQIVRVGDELNLGEDLDDVWDIYLDEGDLPNILTDGEYSENEGYYDNDITYLQEIDLLPGTGNIVFAQDDADAPEAGVYLGFDNNEDIYAYYLDFDDNVLFDPSAADDDFIGTSLEIQGETYYITNTGVSAGCIDRLDIVGAASFVWYSEGTVVKKEINGTVHNMTVKLAIDDEACEFEIDGATLWLDIGDVEYYHGFAVGLLDAREFATPEGPISICKLAIGAKEYRIDTGQEVELNGTQIDGSNANILCESPGNLSEIKITYQPSGDIYLGYGEELVDPVFGNFRFLMGQTVATYENITFITAANVGQLEFTNYNDQLVQIPYIANASGNVFLGENVDPIANPDDAFYLEGDNCTGSWDFTDCEGAQFLAVSSMNYAHVIEIGPTDHPDDIDPEITFFDITNVSLIGSFDYGNHSPYCTGTTEIFNCTFDLAEAGVVNISFNNITKTMTFTDIQNGILYTQDMGILDLDPLNDKYNRSIVRFIENSQESNNLTLDIQLNGSGTNLGIYSVAKSGAATMWGPEDKNATDNRQLYKTTYGTTIVKDSEYFVLFHPEEQLYVDAFITETGNISSNSCSSSQQVNPIPATVNKFDSEISNIWAQNLITVGYACSNNVTRDLINNPSDCTDGLSAGQGRIRLWTNTSYYQMAVYGATDDDTKLAADKLSNDELTLSGYTVTFTTVEDVVEEDDDDDGGGGGGGGGGGPTTGTVSGVTVRLSYIDLKKDEETAVEIDNDDIPVSEIKLQLRTDANGTSRIAVSKVNAKPSAVPEARTRTYSWLEIETTNIPVEKATITFYVEIKWIQDQNATPEEIRLLRYHDDEWQPLPTKVVSPGTRVKFEAVTEGFSTFAIALEEPVVEENASVEVSNTTIAANNSNVTIAKKAAPTNQTYVNPFADKKTSSFPWSAIIVAIILIGALAGGAVGFKKYKGSKIEEPEKVAMPATEEIKTEEPVLKELPKEDIHPSVNHMINRILDEAKKIGYDEKEIRKKLEMISEEDLDKGFNAIRKIHDYVKENTEKGIDVFKIESALLAQGWDTVPVERIIRMMGRNK